MKNNKYHITSGKQNDQGFSLIELLISITILVIIMIPLMNNFVQAILINHKADKVETESNIAADIMEGLKNINMDETVKQFRQETPFHILPDEFIGPDTEETQLVYDASAGEYRKPVNPLIDLAGEQPIYYFAIHGIKSENSVYDALIKMDSTSYRNNPGIMNDCPMPDLVNLDDTANGLLLSNGKTIGDDFDNDAKNYFLDKGKTYANILYLKSPEYQSYLAACAQWATAHDNAQLEGTSFTETYPAEPLHDETVDAYKPYLNSTVVQSEITKTLHITAGSNQIDYKLEYECKWPDTEFDTSFTKTVSSIQYDKIQNIYLFYNPSIFYQGAAHRDNIKIDNSDSATNPVNFYIALQKTAPAGTYITIIRNADDNITTFTNLENEYVNTKVNASESTGTDRQVIVDSKKKDRIYDVTIQICKFTQGDPQVKYKDVLYTLRSTREH